MTTSVEVTEIELGVVELLDAGEIRVEASELLELLEVFDVETIAAVGTLTVEALVLEDPDPVAVEFEGGPPESIQFLDGLIAVLDVFQAPFGLRGPPGVDGAPGADGIDGTPMQPTKRLRPADGWNEAQDTYEDALPTEPLEPTEVVLIHGGVGARFHVDPPGDDPTGTDFQLSGPQNRTIRFGDIRPREGDQIHVEPYLRA